MLRRLRIDCWPVDRFKFGNIQMMVVLLVCLDTTLFIFLRL